MSLLTPGIELVERGLLPDALVRLAIRHLCRQRLAQLDSTRADEWEPWEMSLRNALHSGPIAPLAEKANEQHYELPPEFFAAVLGPRRKYSCCFWDEGISTLAAAEEAALQITCDRAELADGQEILELGCGWGSLSLWMAERYPRARVTAMSNSSPQRHYIEQQAARRSLRNLRVITANIDDFRPERSDDFGERFDRIVSIEMFEHLRNYERLFACLASWLKPDGRLFVHHFCHRDTSYAFETQGAADWMGRYFFSGGMMPSADLLTHFSRHLAVHRHWTWNGDHYRRTAECWLVNLDEQRDKVLPILARAYGPRGARRWFHRWRMFFLAVAELFGYRDGQTWYVKHSLLMPTSESVQLANV